MISPIRAILFDYGGVLAEEGFREGLKAIAQRFGLDPELVHQKGSEAVYESGYVVDKGTEADFWKLMEKKAGLPPYDRTFTREILQRFRLRPRVLHVVRTLRSRGYVTAILSDQTDWLDQLDDRDHFSRHFDRVFNSFHLGKGKRDPSVFLDVVEALGATPEQTLFIDDSIGNVQRAAAQGLKTVLFTQTEDLLAELGKMPALR